RRTGSRPRCACSRSSRRGRSACSTRRSRRRSGPARAGCGRPPERRLNPRQIGPYEVASEIGRGGAGVVFSGVDPQGRKVAIKLLLDPRAPARLARFERERRLLASLGEAEGFVPLLDAGTSSAGPFLVMPFLPGGTLRAKVEQGAIPVAEAIALGK